MARSDKAMLLVAVLVITAGLAVAGTVHRNAGGVMVLVGWVLGIAGLHRLGRAGPDVG